MKSRTFFATFATLLLAAALLACKPPGATAGAPAPRPVTPVPSVTGTPSAGPAGVAGAPVAAPKKTAAPARKTAAPKKAAAPARKTAKLTRGPVQIEILSQYDPVLADSQGDLNLLLRLTGVGKVKAERPPLDLAIVIDRSGSMSGEKIRAVKQAALQLLGKLGPRDRVTLISYADKVRVHLRRRKVTDRGRSAIRREILAISSGGSTALGPALFKAVALLERAERTQTQMAHVILLSDGLANVGEARPEVIGRRAARAFSHGVSVTTLGVGLDYNEDLMTRVADQGGGRYHFIKNESAIAGVLGDELNGLVATVARGMAIRIRPAAGVSVAKVFGYATDREDGQTLVRVGGLRSGQTREILVRLHVEVGEGPGLALGSFTLGFRDVIREGAREQVELPVAVAVSADAGEVKRSERVEVTVRVAEVESSEQLDQAARAVGAGRFDDAKAALGGAIRKVRAQAAATPSPKLNAQLKDLEEAEAGIDKTRTSARERKLFKKAQKSKAYRRKK